MVFGVAQPVARCTGGRVALAHGGRGLGRGCTQLSGIFGRSHASRHGARRPPVDGRRCGGGERSAHAGALCAKGQGPGFEQCHHAELSHHGARQRRARWRQPLDCPQSGGAGLPLARGFAGVAIHGRRFGGRCVAHTGASAWHGGRAQQPNGLRRPLCEGAHHPSAGAGVGRAGLVGSAGIATRRQLVAGQTPRHLVTSAHR